MGFGASSARTKTHITASWSHRFPTKTCSVQKRKIAHSEKNNNTMDGVCNLELVMREAFLAQGSLKILPYLIPLSSCGIPGANNDTDCEIDYSPPG